MKFSAVVALKLQLKSSTVVICVLYFNEPVCLCFWTPRQQLYVMILMISRHPTASCIYPLSSLFQCSFTLRQLCPFVFKNSWLSEGSVLRAETGLFSLPESTRLYLQTVKAVTNYSRYEPSKITYSYKK